MSKGKSKGSIYPIEGGKWKVTIVIGKNPSGRRKVKTFTCKSEAEAKKKLREYNKSIEQGEPVDVFKVALSIYLTDWFNNELTLSLKPKSLDTKDFIINNIIIPRIGYRQMGAITQNELQEFIKDISKKYARSTVKKAYDTLNQAFKRAIHRNELSINPVVGLALPNKDSAITANTEKEIRFFSVEEMDRILDKAIEKYSTDTSICRLGYAVHLLYFTGMRAGEAIALTWDDVDFKNGLIDINKNAVYVKTRSGEGKKHKTIIQQGTAKTDTSYRSIPMSNSARNTLLELQKINGDKNYVLATSNNTPIPIRSFERMFEGIQKRAKIEPKGTLHSLRHSFASRMFENGVDIKIVSEILGHKDVRITYDIYVHIIQRQKAKAVEMIDFYQKKT